MGGLLRSRNTTLSRRGGRVGFSSGSITSVSIRNLVTVARSTEASYQTGAETDGTTAFLAWASTNTARWQSRDGTSRLFLEGSRTNQITYSEDLSNGVWTVGGARTGGFADPDGGTDGNRITCASGAFGVGETAGSTDISLVTASAWIRSTSGTGASGFNLYRVVLDRAGSAATSSTTWGRVIVPSTASGGGGETCLMIPIDGRDWSGVGGAGAGARDHRVWGCQREQAGYASSYIRTSGAEVTRGADVATLTLASTPSFVGQGRFSFVIRPECTSAEFIAANATACLFEFDESGNEHVDMIVDSGAVKLRATSGGATKVTTGAITFTSRWQALTVTVNPSAGTIAVSGATTGNGTTTGTGYTVTPGATLYLGNNKAGTAPYFGELEETFRAA